IPRRARACVPRPVMSSPRSRTRPAVGGCIPVMTLNSVVLPAPFGPMSPVIVPGCTEKVAPLTAVTPPNRTVTSSTSRSGNSVAYRSGSPTDGHLLPYAAGHRVNCSAAFCRGCRLCPRRAQPQQPPTDGEDVADQSVRVATEDDRGGADEDARVGVERCLGQQHKKGAAEQGPAHRRQAADNNHQYDRQVLQYAELRRVDGDDEPAVDRTRETGDGCRNGEDTDAREGQVEPECSAGSRAVAQGDEQPAVAPPTKRQHQHSNGNEDDGGENHVRLVGLKVLSEEVPPVDR